MYRSYSVNNMPELVRYPSPTPRKAENTKIPQNQKPMPKPNPPPADMPDCPPKPSNAAGTSSKNQNGDSIIANIKADDIILIAVVLILLMDDCDDIILIAALGLVLFSDYFGF